MPGQLSIEQLNKLAAEFGTPLYVYHAERIKEQYERLLAAFTGADSKFFYAAKALTNINILRYIRSIGCNIDCSSINEAKLALKAGFSPENIKHLFEPFSVAASGTGLGLSIVHKIVSEHGGRIDVSSADKGGAKILVELPA